MIEIIIPTIGNCSDFFLNQALRSAHETREDLVSKIHILDNSQNALFQNTLKKLLLNYDDSRFKLHNIPRRLGMAENWNLGLENVSAPWLIYLHDDDYLNVKALNSISLSSFEDKGFISFDFIALRNRGKRKVSRLPGLNGVLKNTPKFVSTIISTDKLKAIGGWDPKALYALDLLAFIKLECIYSSQHFSKNLGYYRLHSENASATNLRNRMYGDALPYVLDECFQLVKDSQLRREILFHLSSFIYPNNSKAKKGINLLLRLVGFRAWFE